MRILVTGGAGFIGSHLIEHLLKTTDRQIVSLDRLDTSGNLNRLAHMEVWPSEKKRVKVIWHDLKAPISSQLRAQIGNIDTIFHLAAGTHVDRSIDDPMSFVMDNVVGTTNLLEYARQIKPSQFFYFSTDEIFGPAPAGTAYKEWDRYNSGNPYSAAKAGAEEMCLAYANTYKLPMVITHCMNVFGERQHPEKFIPMAIKKVVNGEKVTIHANKDKTEAGSRFYIHGRNVAAAVLFLWDVATSVNITAKPPIMIPINGDKFNIVGEKEVNNLEMAQLIAKIVGKPLNYEMVDFHSSRPGHDLRYALDGTKMAEMGWQIPVSFESSLEKTVNWYLSNPQWL